MYRCTLASDTMHTCTHTIDYLIESVNESIYVFSVWFVFYIQKKRESENEWLFTVYA